MSHDQIAATLREIVVRELGDGAAASDDSLASVDSLMKMQIATAVEDCFRIRLDREDEAAIDSLASLARVVEQKLAAGG